MRCSRRSLSLRSSCSPRWSSTAGSELRRVEPARATVETLAPERRTSSSGLAPMKAASGVPTQKQKQAGNCSRMAPKRAAGSWAAPALTTTSRASTTLLISPASIRAVAAPTAASKSPGRAGAADLRVRGRVRVEHRQRRLAAQASQARRQRRAARRRVVSRLDDRIEGQEACARRCGRARARAGSASRARARTRSRSRRPRHRRRSPRARPDRHRPAARGARRGPRRRLFAGTRSATSPKRAAPREAASWATPSAGQGERRGPAAPRRTSGRRPAARRKPPRRDRRHRSRR